MLVEELSHMGEEINHSRQHMSNDYDVDQLLDLARFFFPYRMIQRCWRFSLFEHNADRPNVTFCSSSTEYVWKDSPYHPGRAAG